MKYHQGDPRQKVQMCDICHEPTERCEDDETVLDDGRVVCWVCYESASKHDQCERNL